MRRSAGNIYRNSTLNEVNTSCLVWLVCLFIGYIVPSCKMHVTEEHTTENSSKQAFNTGATKDWTVYYEIELLTVHTTT